MLSFVAETIGKINVHFLTELVVASVLLVQSVSLRAPVSLMWQALRLPWLITRASQ